MKILMLLALAIPIIYFSDANAFDDKRTHPQITQKAIDGVSVKIEKYLQTNLTLPQGLATIISDGPQSTMSIREWLLLGAKQEDDPMCRASNHFHNPRNDLSWADSGLADQNWFVNRRCSVSLYPPEKITSAVQWATAYYAPAPNGSRQIGGDNDEDWAHAREYLYVFLTGKTFVGKMIAKDESMRQAFLASSMEALGKVLHLLQDMAVPSHVRNDFLSNLQHTGITGPTLFSPTKWAYEKFERFVETHPEIITGGTVCGLAQKTLTNFWDTNVYDGQSPDLLDMLQMGLAEYTNMNFASDNTIFTESNLDAGSNSDGIKYYHPYPRRTSTNVQKYLDGVLRPEIVFGEDNVPDTSFYIAKIQDGERIDHFIKPTYFSKPLITNETGDLQTFHRSFMLDDACVSEYTSKLIPKAVGYSASLIEYFFRGDFDVKDVFVRRDPGGNIVGINMKITNSSKLDAQPELLVMGDIELSYRYIAPQDRQATYGLIENVYDVDYKTNAINFDYVDLVTDLPNSIPLGSKDISFTIVYRGRLGDEEGCVFGKVLPFTSKIAYSGQPQCGSGPSHIYTVHPDGTKDTQITNDADGYAWRGMPAWSPDGRMLAFNGITSRNQYEIVVLDLTSDQPYPGNIYRKLRHADAHYIAPSFSPDGERLLAERLLLRHPQDGQDLYHSLIYFNLTTDEWYFEGSKDFWSQNPYAELPRWSSRYETVFQYQVGTQNGENIYNIWSVDLDTKSIKYLTDEWADSRWPNWSPDGESVVFGSKRDGGSYYDIWLANRINPNPVKLVECQPSCSVYSFSPDSRAIVFQIAGLLYTVNLDNMQANPVSSTWCSSTPEWSPHVYEKPPAP
ncbi:MAG TPA: hypothetical protein DCZ69_18920 [Syntrophobacteraceae bacterium]|nr:hypothetical protein [Syntrophobacteraceae bacterium]